MVLLNDANYPLCFLPLQCFCFGQFFILYNKYCSLINFVGLHKKNCISSVFPSSEVLNEGYNKLQESKKKRKSYEENFRNKFELEIGNSETLICISNFDHKTLKKITN